MVSAAQIAAQAYAQRTAAPARSTPQPAFTVDNKGLAPKVQPEKELGLTRRLSQETDAYKIDISADALDAAKREGNNRSAYVAQQPVPQVESAAQIAFQPVETVEVRVGGTARREAPFAHAATNRTPDEPPRRPGFLLDITI